ncbi:MAG: TadE/TadG family type IV pilus assembly protein [Thermodesulfobacteriota bacterium]
MPGGLIRPSRTKGEAGNIILELALTLPLFLLLIGGGLDLGMLYWNKHILTNAAREGARAAVRANADGTGRPEKTTSQVQQVVQDYLDKFNYKDIDGSRLVLNSSRFSYTWTPDGTGYLVSVALNQIPYKMMLLPDAQAVLPGGGWVADPIMNLHSMNTMSAEWSSPPGS